MRARRQPVLSGACHKYYRQPHNLVLQALRYSTHQSLNKDDQNDRLSGILEKHSQYTDNDHPTSRGTKKPSNLNFLIPTAHNLRFRIDRDVHGGSLQSDLYQYILGNVSLSGLHRGRILQLYLATRGSLPGSASTPVDASDHAETHRFRRSPTRFNPGFLHLMNQPYLIPEELLPDGTGKRFLPGPPTAWPYRLWARGQFTLHAPKPPLPMTSHPFICGEYVKDVLVPRSGDKAFVTVSSTFLHDLSAAPWVDAGPDELTAAILRKTGQERRDFTSEYTLCFLRNKPNLVESAKVSMPPPSQAPTYVHNLSVSRHLLFTWSALSRNAHLIHLDPSFAREQYGLANSVVHGPLQLYLACEVIQWFFATEATNLGKTPPLLRSVRYECRAPFYVDEPAQVCAMQATESVNHPNDWLLWIQTGPEGSKNVVFKATVTVDYDVHDSKRQVSGEFQHLKG